MSKQKPIVDPEISRILPKLHKEELAQLRADMEVNGQRDAGVVWEEENILLDGHNRLVICDDLGIPFEAEPLSFPDRQSAVDWVYANQLGRRNVAKDERDILIAKRARMVRVKKERPAEAETTEIQGETKLGQNDPTSPHAPGSGDIVAQVAKEFGVSESTVKRAVAKAESELCKRCVRMGNPVRGCAMCAAKKAAEPKKKKKKKPTPSMFGDQGKTLKPLHAELVGLVKALPEATKEAVGEWRRSIGRVVEAIEAVLMEKS